MGLIAGSKSPTGKTCLPVGLPTGSLCLKIVPVLAHTPDPVSKHHLLCVYVCPTSVRFCLDSETAVNRSCDVAAAPQSAFIFANSQEDLVLLHQGWCPGQGEWAKQPSEDLQSDQPLLFFWKILAIRREDQSVWERRAPLSPNNVRKLVRAGVKVLVQPSNRRAYPMQVWYFLKIDFQATR